ncbi:MAG: hypothetical protein NUV84_03415 [Candidatus Uhrbacteria bacterium]|nr:hypothetical protein [Candidatus Uhrbacteria bacterium]
MREIPRVYFPVERTGKESDQDKDLKYMMNLDGLVDPIETATLAVHQWLREMDKQGILKAIPIEEPVVPEGDKAYVLRGKFISYEDEISEMRERVPEVLIPKVWNLEEFSRSPSFPVMLKDPTYNRGQCKYLIEDKRQWRRFLRFLDAKSVMKITPERKQDLKWMRGVGSSGLTLGFFEDPNFVSDHDSLKEDGRYDSELQLARDYYKQVLRKEALSLQHQGADFKKAFFQSVHLQEFIETPGDHYTTYRVLVTATGDIVAAALFYGVHRKSEEKKINDGSVESSDWSVDILGMTGHSDYLRSRDVRSNLAQAGEFILLKINEASDVTQHERTDEEREILSEHRLDVAHPILPPILEQQAVHIAKTVGRKKGLYLGIDFIQSRDGKFYWLETNTGPGLTILDMPTADAVTYMHKRAIEGILKQDEAEHHS